MKRGISPSELKNRVYEVIDFEGEWEKLVGKPEIKGSWLVWGNSTNGKTRFALQLAKYMARFGKVVYNSLEEGDCYSMKTAIEQVNMLEVNRNFLLLDRESIDELRIRLKKDNKIKFVFIDSLQYSGIDYREYKELRDQNRNKIFVWVSHADGRDPMGATAKAIKYDAYIKIFIEGYKAFAQSRYGGGESYVIWEQGANKYWVE